MAATWETSITVQNRAQGRITVAATRTDGEDVRTISVEAGFNQGVETFGEFKARVAVQINAEYLADVAGEDADGVLVGTAEADIKAALEGMEV
jgi:hypothetical protein